MMRSHETAARDLPWVPGVCGWNPCWYPVATQPSSLETAHNSVKIQCVIHCIFSHINISLMLIYSKGRVYSFTLMKCFKAMQTMIKNNL